MSAAQLQAELTALLGELEVIDLCPQAVSYTHLTLPTKA